MASEVLAVDVLKCPVYQLLDSLRPTVRSKCRPNSKLHSAWAILSNHASFNCGTVYQPSGPKGPVVPGGDGGSHSQGLAASSSRALLAPAPASRDAHCRRGNPASCRSGVSTPWCCRPARCGSWWTASARSYSDSATTCHHGTAAAVRSPANPQSRHPPGHGAGAYSSAPRCQVPPTEQLLDEGVKDGRAGRVEGFGALLAALNEGQPQSGPLWLSRVRLGCMRQTQKAPSTAKASLKLICPPEVIWPSMPSESPSITISAASSAAILFSLACPTLHLPFNNNDKRQSNVTLTLYQATDPGCRSAARSRTANSALSNEPDARVARGA